MVAVTNHGENVGSRNHIVVRDNGMDWDALDQLPPEFKPIVWSAPFDLDCTEIVGFVRDGRRMGWPVTVLATELARCLKKCAKAEAETWGPGYPDIPFTPLVAQRRRPARRGRLVL